MDEFDAEIFFKEAQKLLVTIDYDNKLFSLESILAFERKWQRFYKEIKEAARPVQAIYTDILIMYVLLSEDLDEQELIRFDGILEAYSDLD